MLGQDDIQGSKSGFLAGNKAYYVGGHYNCWGKTEDETIGLTHPFYHDLRSRGDGIAYYKGVGTGNDFNGWVLVLVVCFVTERCRSSMKIPESPTVL